MITLNLLALAIGLGLLCTLIVTEAFGIAAGGLVVPGYIALKLLQPVNLALTLVTALAAFALVRIMSSFLVLYGRRMTALTILTAYIIGALLELAIGGGIAFDPALASQAQFVSDTDVDALRADISSPIFVELGVIGYIIPGLIALWFNRQGVLPTLAAITITSVMVRLALVVLVPDALMEYERGNIPVIELLRALLLGS